MLAKHNADQGGVAVGMSLIILDLIASLTCLIYGMKKVERSGRASLHQRAENLYYVRVEYLPDERSAFSGVVAVLVRLTKVIPARRIYQFVH